MGFEIIANQILNKHGSNSDSDIYLELKSKIACQIRETRLPLDAVHFKFTSLPVDCIFTSNYDYLLEYSIDEKFDADIYKPVTNVRNTKYNLSIYRVVGGKLIYHIHGELDRPSTIC